MKVHENTKVVGRLNLFIVSGSVNVCLDREGKEQEKQVFVGVYLLGLFLFSF